jgi:hypothetical protein
LTQKAYSKGGDWIVGRWEIASKETEKWVTSERPLTIVVELTLHKEGTVWQCEFGWGGSLQKGNEGVHKMGSFGHSSREEYKDRCPFDCEGDNPSRDFADARSVLVTWWYREEGPSFNG